MIHTNPEYRSLLAAVLANPEDDLPRLVMADWLEEQGHAPSAGFIRKQIAGMIGTRPLSWIDPTVERLLGKQPHECLRTSNYVLGTWVTSQASSVRYSRGFVDEAACTLAVWCGASCIWCGGRGTIHNDMHYSPDPCLSCNSTGKVSACGPKIVQEHPVTTVILTDCTPETGVLVTAEYRWYGLAKNPGYRVGRNRANITEALFGFLSGGELIGISRPNADEVQWGRTYPTLALAHAALSAAAISWAWSVEPA